MVVGPAKNLTKSIACLVVGFLFFSSSAQTVQIIYHQAKATGISCAGCSKNIHVRIAGNSERILGHVAIAKGAVVFDPILPFDSDLTYELWDQDLLIDTITPVSPDYPATEIVGIFPRHPTLPANILKMHVVFSAPMGLGNSYEHIHFYESEREVFPLLDLQPELWNEDRTIMTLWFDPGRIKRDLLRQQQLGAPLSEQSSYTLVVDDTWSDKNGEPLNKRLQLDFATHHADRTMPDVASWDLLFPDFPGDTLFLTFDESIDYLLLYEAVYVMAGDHKVTGTVFISQDQRRWAFRPDDLWERDADYQLIVEHRLEDLAGNNLSRPFDRNLAEDKEGRPEDVVFTFQLPDDKAR